MADKKEEAKAEEKAKSVKAKKETKKDKVVNNNSETILEVNEITKESIEEEKKEQDEKAKQEKAKADRHRKEKVIKTVRKIFKDKDINTIVRGLMYLFIVLAALSVNISILRQTFSAPTLKIFISEKSLKEITSRDITLTENIKIDLETFDLNIKEGTGNEVVIRYNKKFDKKIEIKGGTNITIKEKNKVLKLIRFDSTNNEMIVEIPKTYKGSIEINNVNGRVHLDKFKFNTSDTEEQKEKVDEDFYKNFFNI